jgi:hypothetical protein
MGLASGATAVANALIFVPMHVEKAVTIDGSNVQCTTIDGTNPEMAVAIHAARANGLPGPKVAGSDVQLSLSVVSATSSRFAAFASPIALSPGMYWRRFMFKGSPVGAGMGTSDPWLTRIIGVDNALAPGGSSTCLSATGYGFNTAVPDDPASITLVASASVNGPMPMFRVSA